MILLQKISLSVLIISTIIGVIFGLAVKGCDISGEEKDKEYRKIYFKGFSWCFVLFVSSAIVLILSFIW